MKCRTLEKICVWCSVASKTISSYYNKQNLDIQWSDFNQIYKGQLAKLMLWENKYTYVFPLQSYAWTLLKNA